MSHAADFLAFWRSVGLEPHYPDRVRIEPGVCIRFRVSGDKAGSKNGAARFYPSPEPAGVVWTYKDEANKYVWHAAGDKRRTRAERAEYHRQVDAMRRAQQEDRRREHEAVAQKAAALWRKARPATDAHPYLQRKGVRSYGLRVLRDSLLVPVRDRHGKLWSLQFIPADPQRHKLFLTGGAVAGCYCPIGVPDGVILVCEGWATGATLHEATGHATAVAFSKDNLGRVAVAMRSKFPDAQIVICADDDAGTPGNPGLTAATAAAQAVGGAVAVPAIERGSE